MFSEGSEQKIAEKSLESNKGKLCVQKAMRGEQKATRCSESSEGREAYVPHTTSVITPKYTNSSVFYDGLLPLDQHGITAALD